MTQPLPIAPASQPAFSSAALAVDGLVALKSPYTAKQTMDRFQSNAKAKGLNIFARVDHAAGAATVGLTLRPTEVLIFGNPKNGTPFMEYAQTAGIDMPLKALVWQDAKGQVWLGYNDPDYLARRHHVVDCPAVGKLSKALSVLAEATISLLVP